jgi:hypothetical protein
MLAEAPFKLYKSNRESQKKKSEVQDILVYLLKSPDDKRAQDIFSKRLREVLEQDSSLDFLEQLRHTVNLHKPVLANEFSSILEILKPAIVYERRQKSPRPRRLLERIIDGLGKKLDFAGIFDTKYEYSKFGSRFISHIRGYSHGEEWRSKVPFPELAKMFSVNPSEIFLCRISTYGIPNRTRYIRDKVLIRSSPKKLLERIIPTKDSASFFL